jgi:hypothetical protein
VVAAVWRRRRVACGFLICALAAFAGFTLALGAAEARVSASKPSWTGTYDCGPPIQTMVLAQSGSSVTGTYTGVAPPSNWGGVTGYNGRISGTLTYPKGFELGRFDGTWTDVGTAPGRTGKLLMMMLVYEGKNAIGVTHSRWGANLCKGTSASPGTTTAPTTPPVKPPSPPGPVDWPTVHAYPVLTPWPLKPGTNAWLPYTVKDASGKAKVYGTLYEGGTSVLEGGTKYFIAADGRKWQWKAHLADDLKGPLRYCLWAVNQKGKESVLKPKSSCAWLSLLVPVAKVSNGCGGGGWGAAGDWVQNYFGNVHTYKDSNVYPLAKSYTVNFKAACDLHDAGYNGMTVYDKINNRTIDFRTWTRKRVDDKFWRDMKMLCDDQIREQEDPGVTATVALAKCKGVGGAASIGSEWLYNKVRYWGSHFFDADLTRPGHQASGHRDNS